MTTRVSAEAAGPTGRLRIYRGRPTGPLRITVVRAGGKREIGPRGLLTIEEAALFMRRPAAAVRRSIAAGLLQARSRGAQRLVTLAACDRYVRTEANDSAAIHARRNQRRIPGKKVHAALGL